MKQVPLFGGHKSRPLIVGYALVDDSDYERVAAVRWNRHHAGYAASDGVFMHRLVMGLGPGDPSVDHHNGDPLDNRRANLRLATQTQNSANQRKTRGTSRFKGVHRSANRTAWRASICVSQRRIHLGYFHSETDAGDAYDTAARLHFGNFARPNR